MAKYEVLSPVRFGADTLLALSPAQYDTRRENLQQLPGGKYKVLRTVVFKAGEVVGVEGKLDKYMSGKLKELEPERPAEKQKEPAAKAKQ